MVLRGLAVVAIDSGEARQAALRERVETATATPLGPSTDFLARDPAAAPDALLHLRGNSIAPASTLHFRPRLLAFAYQLPAVLPRVFVNAVAYGG